MRSSDNSATDGSCRETVRVNPSHSGRYSGETAGELRDRGGSGGRSRLSNDHISPWKSSIPVNGTLLKSHATSRRRIHRRASPRGVIAHFSRQSRNRMIERVRSLNRNEVCSAYLVTLTYPRFFSADPRCWKRDLDAWCKVLVRSGMNVGCVWKLEPQRRAAPHFHLMVFSQSALPERELLEAWHRIAGHGDEKHLRVHLHVKNFSYSHFQRMNDWNGVSSYVSKYVAKSFSGDHLPEFWHHPGRWWGCRGALPMQVLEVPLLEGEFYRLRRLQRGLAKSQGFRLRYSTGRGCRAFCEFETGVRMLAAAGVSPGRLFSSGLHLQETVVSGHGSEKHNDDVRMRSRDGRSRGSALCLDEPAQVTRAGEDHPQRSERSGACLEGGGHARNQRTLSAVTRFRVRRGCGGTETRTRLPAGSPAPDQAALVAFRFDRGGVLIDEDYCF